MGKTSRQLGKYFIVGGTAAVIEWLTFWGCSSVGGIHYIISTVLAFVVATFANWLLGRRMVFRTQTQGVSIWRDLLQVYLASFAGLLINIFLMFILFSRIGIQEMCSKIIATGIVFIWNFGVRKYLIYRE